MTSEKLFEVNGDVELWIVHGKEARMPVLVKPGRTIPDGKEAWLVTGAIPMTAAQVDWLTERLNAVTKARYSGAWLARPERARMIMEKAPGITPSYYVQWGQMSRPVERHTLNGELPGDALEDVSTASDAFMRYVCNQAGISSIAQAGYFWLQFNRAAMNWLLIERKPLDLMFARVHAMPYRRNWLAILANKFPHYLTLAGETPEDRERGLNSTTFNWVCEQPDLCGMHAPGQVEWSLEIEMKDDWIRHSRTWEQRCLAQMGPIDYYKRWLKLVRGSIKWIRSCFHDYFTASSWSVGSVDRGLPAHSRFLRWMLKEGLVHPAPTEIPRSPYLHGAYPPEDEPRKRPNAAAAFADLPEVPDEDYAKRLMDLRPTGGMGGNGVGD